MQEKIEQLKKLMPDTEKIRNMSVIAHVDHGKSTLSDSLVVKAGLLQKEKAGQARATDTMKMEQEKGITIKSTGVSLLYEYEVQKENYLINLIDCPGHIDFSSEVTAALRVTDGALVVVDCVDGVCVQTETVLRQACSERVQSTLMLNKIDRAIVEKKLTGEEIYQVFSQIIDNVNVILTTYLPECLKDNIMNPQLGNVAFGSGKECWAFRIQDFAKIYSIRLNIPIEKMCIYLWGDNFYDEDKKKFSKDQYNENGVKLKRGFVKFIIDPILQLYDLIEKKEYQKIFEKMKKLDVELPEKMLELESKQFRKELFNTWLDAAENILKMIVEHLPSPVQAMKYRVEQLYDGPLDDIVSDSIRKQDKNGPLVMYISKMVPSKDYQKFYAFGRVFSGTITTGQKVFVMGSSFQYGKKDDYYETRIESLVLQMGKNFESVSSVPCGNTIAITGLDKVIKKAGTLTDYKECYPIKNMKFTVSPVVQVAVQPKNSQELPQLINGLTKLSKSDPLVQVIIDQNTSQQIVCGSGELHVQVCLTLLREEFAKIDIIESQPIVTYKETVTLNPLENCEVMLTKSSNKLNRLFVSGSSLQDELTKYIEDSNSSKLNSDNQEFRDLLVDKFEWGRDDTKRIWTFGPDQTCQSNILLDSTKQVQGLNAIQDSIIVGFNETITQGVFTGEKVRGLKCCINDAVIHSDPVHRGSAQIIPMAKKIFQAVQIASKPQIYEPIYFTEIQVPQEYKGNVYTLINKRRGEIIEEIIVDNTPLCILKAYLPVAESFSFTDKLREVTQGTALNQCAFDHWSLLSGDLYQPSTLAGKVVLDIRKRKGMKPQLPILADYYDKL